MTHKEIDETPLTDEWLDKLENSYDNNMQGRIVKRLINEIRRQRKLDRAAPIQPLEPMS